jgi:hypothetical protein
LKGNQDLFKEPPTGPQSEIDADNLTTAYNLKDLEEVLERLEASGKEISDELVKKTDQLINRVIRFS